MALQEELENQGVWLFRYRGTLPLILLVIGTTLYLRTEIYPEAFFLNGTPYKIIFESFCLLISLIGLGIRVYTVGHTPRNTSGRNVAVQLADSLNTSGIYSVVRHPLYLGNFFMWLGPALITGNLWFIIAFCLFYWVYYERIMFAEEQFLRRKFGSTYTDWAENVPAFIPKFNFKKPKLAFSWKKVLKKEKNGLAAVFAIFCLYDIAGTLISKEADNFNWFLIVMCILTIFMYIVLKYLKYRTNLLNESNR